MAFDHAGALLILSGVKLRNSLASTSTFTDYSTHLTVIPPQSIQPREQSHGGAIHAVSETKPPEQIETAEQTNSAQSQTLAELVRLVQLTHESIVQMESKFSERLSSLEWTVERHTSLLDTLVKHSQK